MAPRKHSAFDDFIEIAASFPWWIGVVSALVFYALLHEFAAIEGVPENPGKGLSAVAQLGKTLAFYTQYIVPALFLVASGMSFRRQRRLKALRAEVRPLAPAEISWKDFELVVADFFRRRGFLVRETGGHESDRGTDLLISSGDDRYVVQCKNWKARQVGSLAVAELYAAMVAQHAVGGFVVASGALTDDARKFAEAHQIELIPAAQLVYPIREHPARATAQNPRGARGAAGCPRCGASMILQEVSKGDNPQDTYSFWGCSKYPNCLGTRAAETETPTAATRDSQKPDSKSML